MASPVPTFASSTPEDLPEIIYQDGFYLTSFRKAKRYLMQVYTNQKKTFYCACNFTSDKQIDHASCGVQTRKNTKRSRRLEWEHIVPAHRFGSALSCWQARDSFSQCQKANGKTLSGRKCCRRVNKKFREMEADMVNLVPAVGEINGDRSNYPFGEIAGEARKYGQCDIEIDFKNRLAEPNPDIRGNIARIYFYFEKKYGMTLTNSERSILQAWHTEDPIDKWELEKSLKVREMLVAIGKQRQSAPSFAANE